MMVKTNLLSRSKRSKKGVIEVGFSWIFILLAGTVILGLFSYIAFSQGSFFNDLIDSNMLSDLNTIFVGAQMSKNTAAEFEIPDTEFRFNCNSYGIGKVSHPNQGRIVFAPEDMKTSKLLTWSRPWGLGFRVVNFLYITSPSIKYYIAYKDDNEAEEFANIIYDGLPSQIDAELIPLDGSVKIEDQNYERIITLVVGYGSVDDYSIPPGIYYEGDFRGYSDDEIIFIYALKPPAGYYLTDSSVYSGISFLDKNLDLLSFDEFDPNGNSKQNVYGLSSIYAAFISGNIPLFQCMSERAFKKARHVSEIYKERARMLQDDTTNNACSAYYSLALDEFNNMDDNLYSEQPDGSISILINNLGGNIKSFDIINENLERASCPLLY